MSRIGPGKLGPIASMYKLTNITKSIVNVPYPVTLDAPKYVLNPGQYIELSEEQMHELGTDPEVAPRFVRCVSGENPLFSLAHVDAQTVLEPVDATDEPLINRDVQAERFLAVQKQPKARKAK